MDGENHPYEGGSHHDRVQGGALPLMSLYHSRDKHFNLLVEDISRLVTSGLLGRSNVAEVQ